MTKGQNSYQNFKLVSDIFCLQYDIDDTCLQNVYKCLQKRDLRFELCYSPSSKYDDVISALQSVSSVILFKSLEINYSMNQWIERIQ